MKTQVVFRKFRDGGDVIALFPCIHEGPGLISSYMHIGQHGPASWRGCLADSRNASPAEYAPLLSELASIGYEPIVCKVVRGRILPL